MTEMRDAMRRWGVPGLFAAKGGMRVALPFALGAALLAGSFVWATGRLPERIEPPRERILSARLDWPEIKNGVPELKRVDPAGPSLAQLPPAQLLPAAPEPRLPSAAVPPPEQPTASVPAPSPPASVGHGGIFDPAPFSSAAVLGGIPSSPEAKGEKPAVPDPTAATPAASASPAPDPIEDARARPPGGPPASPPVEAATIARREGADSRKSSRGAQQAGAGVPARSAAAEGGGRPRNGDARQAEARQAARPERRRVAAASPSPAPDDGPAVGGPAPSETAVAPESEPLRVLGVPLPAGRRIKECLLELRC